MEKIVTKIGDVTIERRISKPKVSLETPYGNIQQSNHPLPKITTGTPNVDKVNNLGELTESNNTEELMVLNKNVTFPSNKNIVNKTFNLGGEIDLKFNPAYKKPANSNSNDFLGQFPRIETPQNVDGNFQYMPQENSDLKILEMKESGMSLPKVPRLDMVQKQPVTVTVNEEKNEPYLSKFVGISIERKKRLDMESQSGISLIKEDLNQTQNINSGVSIKRIHSKGSPKSNSNMDLKSKEVLSEEDSFDDDEFGQENRPCSEVENTFEESRENLPGDSSLTDLTFDEEHDRSESDDVAVVEDDSEEIKKPEEEDDEIIEDDEEPIKEEELSKEEVECDTKEADVNDLACTELVELMQKGEIEGEIEDVKDEEIINESGEKKSNKRKAESNEEEEEEDEDDNDEEDDIEDDDNEDDDEDGETKEKKLTKKKRKSKKKKRDEEGIEEEGDEEGKDKNIDKSKITNANLRKNIREVMDETKLDEATLAAQRQEAERLKRLQEQQRIIREVQRQIALNRQNQKSQNKVLSLLQGNSQTSILKTSSTATQAQNSQTKTQNSVLVKLSNGEQTSLNNKKMIELLKNSKNKTILGKPPIPKTLFKQGMVTPSVSIAPVVKKEIVIDDKKKKKGDIVTLSSDSEDDCIVLSDEDESEPEEDPTNSGMHTNDKYNLPDEKGRVIVNVGHPESETDLYLAPQIARIIKPHQIGGIRFLYDNVIESTERFSTSAGFGCILAHSMGLGKTLQIVSFSDIFLRYTSARTILCIMPINTIQNWLAEFNMWLPKESSAEDVRCRDFDLFIVNESLKNINARSKVILDWQKSGGVLLMGYELFRLLSLKKSYKSKKKKKDQEEEDAKNKELIEEVYSALVLPGPDLVICDEGHRIKNSHATTSQALKQIRTKRRIVLTGYPLQNNLLEYWCMVDFVRPNYLGTKTEFSNMFERPIQNGQCIDSTPQDKRLMRYRAHVLHSLLEGFVQRRSHAVLQSALPEKEEYVLLLRFTPFQRKLYDTFMNEVVRTVAVPNPLKAFAVCCKIWNHPDVLYNFLKKKGEEIDLDLEEALPPSLQIPQFPYGQSNLGLDGTNQQMPGVSPWPRRGPGSRGGKVRQSAARRIGRGRKPAATIPPNVTTGQDKGNETFGSGHFPTNDNYSSQHENMENFQGRNYNQSQFGFGNEYDNQSSYGNPNYNKNPMNNLEDMSSSNFQSKRFFSQSNDSGNQVHYGNPQQNFDSGQQSDTSFNQNNTNESNLNASFDSNLNSRDSNYNQNDPTKTFDYNQEFNSEFYSAGNFQNSGTGSNYPRDNKAAVFPSNPSFFQNQSFRNPENFDYQSGNNMNASSFPNYERPNANFQNSASNQNFQQTIPRSASNQRGGVTGSQVSNFQNSSLGNNFQDSNSGSNSNFSNNFQSQDSSFETNRFGQNSNSNFQGNNSSFEMNRNKNFQGQNTEPNFQGGNYTEHGFWSQTNWGYTDSSKSNADYRSNAPGNDFMPQQKFSSFDEGQDSKTEGKNFGNSNNNNSAMFGKINCDYSTNFEKSESESKVVEIEENKGTKQKEEDEKKEETKNSDVVKKEDSSLPYDWATDLFKAYVTGVIENSSKMEVFFHIVTESIKLGDRLLVFSQSLLTLDLIEDYLHRRNVPDKEEVWARNRNYFRLDGSTPGLEREKLINEFNGNSNIYLFLVSTRAGSLGINLVGANRVVVFDASWNPCHDTQAVCRVYRYGQRKPCFVYRLVMDSCLEKKIYDRQVNKQGMADRVVDELNPDAHLSIKEVTNLCWDDQEDTTVKDFSHLKEKYNDEIIKILLDRCSKLLSKEPFQHESLLIDRKEKKLSQAEKRLAKRSYELEKQAANQPKSIYSFFPNTGQRNFAKPIASVRPMQSEINTRISPQLQNRSKWIPAEVWQKQGMSAQEMTLPLDVVIPTSSPEKTSIVLKAGQRVMVLKSPKGIYMQLENGKIIAIRSAFKVGQNGPGGTAKNEEIKKDSSTTMTSSVKSAANVSVSPKVSQTVRPGSLKQPFLKPFAKIPEKKVPVNMNAARSRQIMGKAKPFLLNRKFESVTPDVKQRLMGEKVSFNNQEEKFNSSEPTIIEDKITINESTETNTEEGSFSDEKVIDSSDEKTEEKPGEKCEMTDSLETLRKVTEKISDSAKREEAETEVKYPQINTLKNYRHNFTSQMKGNTSATDDKVRGEGVEEEKVEKVEGSSQGQQQGNENVQNWLMNQSYPPMDPYGNYFPGYYAYGPGPGPMMPPYDGFYPPSNYGHPMGRNSPMVPPGSKQQVTDNTKGNSQPVQPLLNPIVQNVHNSTTRNPPVVNTPPMYPPYPNPYPYPYNYPSNPNFNSQGFPFPNQNQSTQQTTQNSSSGNNNNTSGQNQPTSYDNSMYSAFHRPEAPFQGPENPYPTPYPRPPYPSSGTPGFFPYNSPYPNYPYGHNFNPYMHPTGYGYPMQNHPSGSSQGTNTSHSENAGIRNSGSGSNTGASNSASSNSS